ncbi:hypothetical protein AB0G73_33170 [Streptomyces sp. NPDC020719]|uniref:hypothetical protein n=1 Tax=Streptomyces sp. NPDC020719 TaxID=3154896 RepID=UPI0033D405BE
MTDLIGIDRLSAKPGRRLPDHTPLTSQNSSAQSNARQAAIPMSTQVHPRFGAPGRCPDSSNPDSGLHPQG